MRVLVLFVLGGVAAAGAARSQDLADICGARTSYDVTLRSDALVFSRGAPAARTLVLSSGALTVDGHDVTLDDEDRDRIALIERNARALAPRVKAIAQRSVDLGAQAVRGEAASYAPQITSDPRFAQTLDEHAHTLKARIAASTSTTQWQGDNLDRIVDSAANDLLPIVAQDAAQQALDALVSGDFSGAGALGGRTATLQADLEARVRQRLQTLAPDVRALCPALDEIDALQSGVVADIPGGRLDLIEIAR
ncbi:MAG: DUF2884 family protein [Rhodanobacteraceae bacterium]|nr:YggN family protein [Pseudomonadota bacterium]